MLWAPVLGRVPRCAESGVAEDPSGSRAGTLPSRRVAGADVGGMGSEVGGEGALDGTGSAEVGAGIVVDVLVVDVVDVVDVLLVDAVDVVKDRIAPMSMPSVSVPAFVVPVTMK